MGLIKELTLVGPTQSSESFKSREFSLAVAEGKQERFKAQEGVDRLLFALKMDWVTFKDQEQPPEAEKTLSL